MDYNGIYGKQQVSLAGDAAPLEVYRRKTLARLTEGALEFTGHGQLHHGILKAPEPREAAGTR